MAWFFEIPGSSHCDAAVGCAVVVGDVRLDSWICCSVLCHSVVVKICVSLRLRLLVFQSWAYKPCVVLMMLSIFAGLGFMLRVLRWFVLPCLSFRLVWSGLGL